MEHNIDIKNNSNTKITTFLSEHITRQGRPPWDSFFMAQACLASLRSSCDRLNVGCVIVKDHRVITTGYNGFLKGAPHVSRVRNGHEQFTIHAEQNAICDAANRGVSMDKALAYITHYPCINCFKLLIAAGIKGVIYLDDYKNDELVLEMALENNVKLIKLQNS
tara:strand:- start:215 stop:706 length:492 start_codon:yes stop_codon:yes gene_type:complete